MKHKFYFCVVAIVLLLSPAPPLCAQTLQTPTPPVEPTQQGQQKPVTTVTARHVVVQNAPNAPQVVTLLHRLSGLKMFRLLLRSGEARAVERWDEAFTINGAVHTNVIAGLSLDDAGTVVAWLPDVDAELGPPLAPSPPMAPSAAQPESPLKAPRGYANAARRYGLLEKPNLTVIAQDHQRLTAKYIGLDGVTGLSVLKLPESVKAITNRADAADDTIAIGQRVRLFAPEPVTKTTTGKGPIYARVAETEARITQLMRAPAGGITRVEIKSPRLSPANIGGVVLNDAGKTVGIIASVKASEATVLTVTSVRNAAKRVLARQASVPRPWLGIRGESIESFSADLLLRNGWQADVASFLAQQQQGILLTSVVPGSPASTAALRPGDVILSVNEGVVRSAQDFSWVLEEAGPGASVRFSVARPGKTDPQAVEVMLTEAPDPFLAPRPQLSGVFNNTTPTTLNTSQYQISASLLANGLETITLLPKVASQLGSNGGLLVVYVEPATAAYKAGLRPGDLIESINGQNVNASRSLKLNEPGATYSCTVIRNKQKFVFKFDFKPKE